MIFPGSLSLYKLHNLYFVPKLIAGTVVKCEHISTRMTLIALKLHVSICSSIQLVLLQSADMRS